MSARHTVFHTAVFSGCFRDQITIPRMMNSGRTYAAAPFIPSRNRLMAPPATPDLSPANMNTSMSTAMMASIILTEKGLSATEDPPLASDLDPDEAVFLFFIFDFVVFFPPEGEDPVLGIALPYLLLLFARGD